MTRVRIEPGDCLEIIPMLVKEGVRVDAIVTDPPYHLTQASRGGSPRINDPSKPHGRHRLADSGFMGKQWDGGDIAFRPETWRHCLKILKPGGHLLAFGGPRTFGFVQVAIAEAGFEIRDTVLWLFGSGFPKSHDVSKAIDRAAGIEREVVGKSNRHGGGIVGAGTSYEISPEVPDITAPATEAARQWQGWGTALKPAAEFIVQARKPLSEKTIAANVLEHGTGALNIDGCLVEGPMDGVWGTSNKTVSEDRIFNASPDRNDYRTKPRPGGRWPANVIHDGSPEVLEAFARFGNAGASGKASGPTLTGKSERNCMAGPFGGTDHDPAFYGDTGTAARFFYSAKADAADRLGSKHPTVKPVDLIAYLCRLVTPPGGTVLDPFAGSGTTAMACLREGFECILIEREAEYIADIRRRLDHVSGADTPLFSRPD
ncbi:MAG: site-specific DNA-methyltransferase [Proteobacteria bacterium]|nr:site-specific DNA-methyltransferase [Pseudomonadota bacterium]